MFTVEQEFFEQMIEQENPMAQAVIAQTDRRRRPAGAATVVGPMTCDIPVVAVRRTSVDAGAAEQSVCRPTGRPERRLGRADDGRAGRGSHRRLSAAADRVGGMCDGAEPSACGWDRSNTAAVYRRRRLVASTAVGVALAGAAWVLAFVGAGYEDAMTPATPGVTQVVHVRSGESLNDVATRIAADLPVDGVVARLREMNHLESVGLRVGQALIAPAY